MRAVRIHVSCSGRSPREGVWKLERHYETSCEDKTMTVCLNSSIDGSSMTARRFHHLHAKITHASFCSCLALLMNWLIKRASCHLLKPTLRSFDMPSFVQLISILRNSNLRQNDTKLSVVFKFCLRMRRVPAPGRSFFEVCRSTRI